MVKILDYITGCGKSNYVIEQINKHPNNRHIYITPFLSEAHRVIDACKNLNFKEPLSNYNNNKADHLQELIEKDENICSTHQLFRKFTNKIIDLLVEKDYHLWVDESLDCITDVNIPDADLKLLMEHNIITPDPIDKDVARWNSSPLYDGCFSELKNLCDLGVVVFYYNASSHIGESSPSLHILLLEVAPRLFKELANTTVITYMFDSTIMSHWFRKNKINYSYLQVDHLKDRQDSIIKGIKSNINIVNTPSISKLQGSRVDDHKYKFSYGWYKRSDSNRLKKIKNLLSSLRVGFKISCDDVFWTCPKSNFDNNSKSKVIASGGFKSSNTPDADSEDGYLSPWLSSNSRATNKYKDRGWCIHLLNIYRKPTHVNYLEKHGIEFDQDGYALSELIQFVWRGCIRENKQMNVVILSKRMQDLFVEWLNSL